MLSLCFSFCALSAATDLANKHTFLLPPTPAITDVSLCVRKIIEDITEEDHFIKDVILININEAIEIHKIHGIKKARYMTRSYSWVNNNLFNKVYIVSAVDITEFENGMKQAAQDYYFNARANFIIVIENFKGHQEKMVDILGFYNIYYASVLTRNVEDDYEIYSFESPVSPCQERGMVVVSRCSSYEMGSYDLIFSRIEGIRGCSFNLMTYNHFPVINFDNPDEEGVEQRILRYFEKYTGVIIHLISYSKTDRLGQIASNFPYTDILDKVRDNFVDGAVGGYTISFLDTPKYSFSYPLTVDHMMVVLPRGKLEDIWEVLFGQKNQSVIILVMFLFIIFSIAAHVFSLFPTQHNDFVRNVLIIFGYFLNKVTIYKFRQGIPATFVIGSLLFAVFILPFTIQSFLLSIKTYPMRSWEPKSFDEVNIKYTVVLSSGWPKTGLFKQRQECESAIDCLEQVRDERDKSLYTLVSDEAYEAYKFMLADKQCNIDLHKIKEPFSTVMRSVFFRRGSVLERPFNEFTSKLISAGLIRHYYDEISFKELLKCKPMYIPPVAPLSMFDFKGAYYILLAGYFLSAISFVFEVLT